jgi:hypothetical protein
MRLNKTLISLMAASGLALPSIAMAQLQPAAPAAPSTAQPAPGDPTVGNSPTATAPAPAQAPAPGPSAAQPPAGPASPPVAEAAPSPGAPTTPGNPQVVAFVNSQFPSADANGDGSLSKEEFDAWVGKMKVAEAQQQGKPVDQAEVTSYATAAFARADADKSLTVSRSELTQFLQG